MSYYIAIAEEQGIIDPKPGGITFIQRFGSALNLNYHAHILTIEGVYSEVSGKPVFYPVRGPRDEEISQIVEALADTVIDMLKKRKYLSENPEEVIINTPDKIYEENEGLNKAVHASTMFKIAFGERTGQRVRVIGKGFGYEEEHAVVKGSRCASSNNFTIHADRFIGAQERDKLKDLISYASRGPFSHDLLSLKDPNNSDGDLVYKLKRSWSDGTQSIILSQEELIEKIIALIPEPYIHQTKYFGVLSSHSEIRPKIILKPGVKKGFITKLGDSEEEEQIKLTWSELLKKTFKIDIMTCQECGAHIDSKNCTPIHDSSSIKRILEYLGITHHPPPIKPARYVQGSFDFDQRTICYGE
jgi:hypothetical protein